MAKAKFNPIVRYILSKGVDKDGGILSGLADWFAKMFLLSSAGYYAYRVPTARADLRNISEALYIGGYLNKNNVSGSDFLNIVETTISHNHSQEEGQYAIRMLLDDAIKAIAVVSGLSENRVVSLVAKGHSEKAIAVASGLSENRVVSLVKKDHSDTNAQIGDILVSAAQKIHNNSFGRALTRIKSDLAKLEDLEKRGHTRQMGNSSEKVYSPAPVTSGSLRVVNSDSESLEQRTGVQPKPPTSSDDLENLF